MLQKEEVTTVNVRNPVKVGERGCIFSSVKRLWEKPLYFSKSRIRLQKGGRAVEAEHPFIVAVLNTILQRKSSVNKDH